MFRLRFFLTIAALLGLPVGLVVGASQISEQSIPQAPRAELFEVFSYPLGAYSGLIGETLLGNLSQVEGESEDQKCSLEFGLPPENFSEWIHPVALICHEGNEDNIWPLGEGVFRKAYSEGRYLLRGTAAETLNRLFMRRADTQDVESPISLRKVAWGPSNIMRIVTLRGSDTRGNLHFSIECYSDEKTEATLSCALQF